MNECLNECLNEMEACQHHPFFLGQCFLLHVCVKQHLGVVVLLKNE